MRNPHVKEKPPVPNNDLGDVLYMYNINPRDISSDSAGSDRNSPPKEP